MLHRMPNLLTIIKNNSQNCTKVYPDFTYKLKFDGCSKGNPGLAGAGAVIYHENAEIWCGSVFVSEKATNNYAEYSGLVIGLKKAVELNIQSICVEGDSLLVINQMTGKYKCNSENLLELHYLCTNMVKQIDSISFNHVLRNENKRADQLANEAVEKYINKNIQR